MRRGTHAADDGSFSRSAGNAAIRGALLIVAAVVLGLVMLRATDAEEPFASRDDAGSEETDDTATDGTTVDGTTDTTDTTLTTVPVRPPQEVKVLVANGARVQGAASRRAADLTEAGYQIAGTTNTKTTMQDSRVYFTEGYQAEAEALAQRLSPPAPVEGMPADPPVADLAGAHVVFVVGVANAG